MNKDHITTYDALIYFKKVIDVYQINEEKLEDIITNINTYKASLSSNLIILQSKEKDINTLIENLKIENNNIEKNDVYENQIQKLINNKLLISERINEIENINNKVKEKLDRIIFHIEMSLSLIEIIRMHPLENYKEENFIYINLVDESQIEYIKNMCVNLEKVYDIDLISYYKTIIKLLKASDDIDFRESLNDIVDIDYNNLIYINKN